MEISTREFSEEWTSSAELVNPVILPRGVFFALIGSGGGMSAFVSSSSVDSFSMLSRDLADLSKLVDGERLPEPPDKLLPLGGEASGDEVLDSPNC